MVSVVVLRPFDHLGRYVDADECIELDPLDAAVKAHAGLVSLMHGRTYQTREMVAAPGVDLSPGHDVVVPVPASMAPLKRRRGRPRKSRD